MKVVRPSLNILISMLSDLDEKEQILREKAEAWSEQQDYRDNGIGVDPYWVAIKRNNLEEAIVEYRRELARIYDFMGDKGLV